MSNHRAHLRTIPFALALLSAACAAAGGGGATPRGSNDMLTREQLAATNETDLYVAIQRLKPTWLRPRGQTTLSGLLAVAVYVDGTLQGDVSMLQGMPVSDVQDIEYLSGSEATFRFGTAASHSGALVIRSRR